VSRLWKATPPFEVTKAGGKMLSQPEAFDEGYYGFMFADPDGHRFNVFYM
jgi:predicted lactoylglutathione lyase